MKTILSIGLLGFFAGAMGGLITASLFTPFPVTVIDSVFSRLDSKNTSRISASLGASVSASVVDFFIIDGSKDVPALLPLGQRVGRGVVLTNDGWVVTLKSALQLQVLAGPSQNRRGDSSSPRRWSAQSLPVIVGGNRFIHTIDRIALDPISDLAFVHAVGLEAPVLSWREQDSLRLGDQLFAPTPNGGLQSLALTTPTAPLNAEGSVRSSEHWSSFLFFTPEVNVPVGTPLVDSSEALVGLVINSNNQAIIVDAVTSAFGSLFSRGIVERNSLGVGYRNAAEFGHGVGELSEGAILTGGHDETGRVIPTFSAGSPLAGKLKESDVIVAIGEDSVTLRRPLPQLLQEYPLGANVRLQAKRSGKPMTLDVSLVKQSGEVFLVAAPVKSGGKAEP